MDPTPWRSLYPWCRALRGVVEAVQVPAWRAAKVNSCDGLEYELRVLLPRSSHFALDRWTPYSTSAVLTPTQMKLVVIREALELLWLVRSIDASAWEWLLVHQCGAVGHNVRAWSSTGRILPVLQIQPCHADEVDDILIGAQQCEFLLATLQDEGLLTPSFHRVKRELCTRINGANPSSEYRVILANWMGPRASLNDSDTDSVWQQIARVLRQLAVPVERAAAGWRAESFDVFNTRFTLTLDTLQSLIELAQDGIAINELRIDLRGKDGDHVTARGMAATLAKLLTSPRRPRSLRIDCRHATTERMEALVHVLDACASINHLHLDQFGLVEQDSEASTHFECLGRILRHISCQSLHLEAPDLSLRDVATITTVLYGQKTGLKSFELSVDCHAEAQAATQTLLRLVGGQLASLSCSVNGGTFDEDSVESILTSCPHVEHFRLDKCAFSQRSPFFTGGQRRLRSLTLSRFVPVTPVLLALAQRASQWEHAPWLTRLDLDLSELDAVDDEVLAAFAETMEMNPTLSDITLTMDRDTMETVPSDVQDSFTSIHNAVMLHPVPLRAKTALLSAMAQLPSSHHLSRWPLTLIFQFAATRSVKAARIRTPARAW